MGKSPKFAKNGRKPEKTYGNGFNYYTPKWLIQFKAYFLLKILSKKTDMFKIRYVKKDRRNVL